MKKAETSIRDTAIAYIKACKGDAHPVHGSVMQRRGEPDIDGAIPHEFGNPLYALHLKIEVKVPGEEATDLQLKRLREYARLGYYTAVIHSLDELRQALVWFWGSSSHKWGYE